MKNKIFTNCFLIKTNKKGKPYKVCLALKKRGFGKDFWNGSGGKPEEGETIKKAVLREVQEEFNVKVKKLDKRGEVSFVLKKEKMIVLMHTFFATDWEGEPTETEEMKPQWFTIKNVPYKKMWKSDKEWLPIILSGKKIKAKYSYSHEGGKVETRELTEIGSFD